MPWSLIAYTHVVLERVGLSTFWLQYMCHCSSVQTNSFSKLSNRHISLCHYDTQPATAWDHYCYLHITIALQGQILGHRDSVKKFIQSVLWFACISLLVIWFYLTCSWLISCEHVWFPRKALADFHFFQPWSLFTYSKLPVKFTTWIRVVCANLAIVLFTSI